MGASGLLLAVRCPMVPSLFLRSLVRPLVLLALSACSPEANDNQSDSGAPPDEVANPTLQGREEAAGGTGAASSLGGASGDAPSKSPGGESEHLLTGGAESVVCATEERFEELSELPPELAPHLLRTTSLDVDGITRSFYLRSWVEDDGLFLWFATEGDDTHNLLLDTESGAWSLIEGEAHEPRVALAGQFLAFEKDDLDVDLSVGHRFDPESSTWTPLPPLGAPLLRRSQLEVATDRGYFVWGGNGKVADTDEYSLLAEGGYLDAATWTWTPTSTSGAPSLRWGALIAPVGESVVIYGGHSAPDTDAVTEPLSDGYRYDPQSNSWSPISSTSDLPQGSLAVGAGDQLLVLRSGSDSGGGLTGALYDLESDSWSPANMSGAPVSSSMLRSLSSPGGLNQLLFAQGWAGPDSPGETLYIYDLRTDAWRSHSLSAVLSSPQFDANSEVGGRVNMDYYWQEGSLIIWGGDVTTSTPCDEATRAANPGVGCDARVIVFTMNDGARMQLICPE